MNTPTKSKITTALDKLRKRIVVVEKDRADLATAQEDLVKLEERVAAIGEPDYRDDKSINDVTALQLKASLCSKAIERLSSQPGVESLNEILPECAEIAAELMFEIADKRKETVILTLLPFSLNRASAEKIADKTDACIGAQRTIRGLLGEVSFANQYPGGDNALRAAKKVELILEEAVKRSPNLVQFLPFQASEVAEETAIDETEAAPLSDRS